MFTLAQTSHHRRCSFLFLAGNSLSAATLIMSAFAFACALAPAAVTLAQQPPAAAAPTNPDDKLLYIGAIAADNVYVRSGQGDSYYPFFKLNRGDLVKVTEEKFGYVRVTAVGPAFRDAYGYIKHPKNDNSKLRLSPDNKTATTLGRVDILAPNLDLAAQPKDSWKTLVRLPADQAVSVIEMKEMGDDVIYKVSLPASASGWISAQFVPRASAEDAEMFKQILAGKIESPKPTATPTPSETLRAQDAAERPKTGDAAQPPAVAGTDPAATQQPDASPETTPPDSLATAAPEEASTQPEQPREPTLEDLEQRFDQLRKEPIETAEVMPLRELYVELAERHPNDRRISRACEARAAQLAIWSELQAKRQEVMAARDKMKATADETDAARATLERSAEYTAVGRIASSTIYDGASLPKLFRIQDPATGRTIAYLKPDADYTLANRIDVIVGIVGDKTYDESLRLNIITPRRIETLSPEKASTPAGAGGTKDVEDK
jgi:hypothetical protein